MGVEALLYKAEIARWSNEKAPAYSNRPQDSGYSKVFS